MSETEQSRAGITAIVGRPNVGKSTLLNRMLGEKLAIVSSKPQTTRNRILGIHNVAGHQVVLLDTPGIHRSRVNLNRYMVQEALESIHDVDCVLLLTEVCRGGADEIDPADRYVLEQIGLQQARCPLVVVINKIDLLKDRQLLLPEIAAWHERGYASIVPISARTGDGVDRLVDEIVAHLPEGPPLYPDDALTDRAERFLAAELIREQVFVRCHQELPYATAVLVELFEERERPPAGAPAQGASAAGKRLRAADVWIEAVIHVERASQKGILIGKQGAMIKAIGCAARKAIGRLLGCEVHLKLTVRVEADWSRRPAGRRKLGYEG